MKALVTGATGFVGSWLTRRLLDEGIEVTVLHREGSDTSQIADLKLRHVIGDICNLESLKTACANQDVVFHCAGFIGYSPDLRELMEQVNVHGTQNVVNACKTCHVPKTHLYEFCCRHRWPEATRTSPHRKIKIHPGAPELRLL